MSKKTKKFRHNENVNSVAFTAKLNALVDAVNRANNLRFHVRGGTGGIVSSKAGHNVYVSIPSTTSTGGTTTSTASTVWGTVTQALEYDDGAKSYYTLELSDETEVTVRRAIGYQGYADDEALDLRNYMPWFVVGSVVPLVLDPSDPSSGEYMLNLCLNYIGPEEECSLRWNEDDERSQAVWV